MAKAKKTTAQKADETRATGSVAGKKAATEEQFAEADAKAAPDEDDMEAQRVQLQVRGF